MSNCLNKWKFLLGKILYMKEVIQNRIWWILQNTKKVNNNVTSLVNIMSFYVLCHSRMDNCMDSSSFFFVYGNLKSPVYIGLENLFSTFSNLYVFLSSFQCLSKSKIRV